MELLIPILLGWPAIIGSLGLLVWAVIAKNARLSLAGALLSTGFCLYLTGMSWLVGPAVYACNWGSYWYLRKQRYRKAAYLVVPYGLIAIQLAILVLLQ